MAAPDMAVEHLGAEYFQDPDSVHARLREQRPVTPVIMPDETPAWLVTGYAEARAALADPRLRKNMPGRRQEPDSIYAALEVHMLNSDPPDHERLRRLVNKAFTARRVERLRPRITAITTRLLDDMSTLGGQAEVDLLSALTAARDDGDGLSENELVSMAFLLLVAGHQTTVNLIGSGVLALLLNPAELARLRADP